MTFATIKIGCWYKILPSNSFRKNVFLFDNDPKITFLFLTAHIELDESITKSIVFHVAPLGPQLAKIAQIHRLDHAITISCLLREPKVKMSALEIDFRPFHQA